MKHRAKMGAALLAVTLLVGCASNPDKEAVVGKNDGAFDTALIQTATVPNVPQQVQVTEAFTSTDGSVEFTMRLDQTIMPPEVPVVEVVPHYLTGEDARRISQVLFGEDAVFYEKEPFLGPFEEVFTREDALAALQRWSKYASNEALQELYGEHIFTSLEQIQQEIAELTAALELIPEDRAYREAEWTMKPEAYYFYTQKQIEEENEDLDWCNDEVAVTTDVGDIPYILSFTTRNKDDYKLNSINVKIDVGFGSGGLDSDIARAALLRTAAHRRADRSSPCQDPEAAG